MVAGQWYGYGNGFKAVVYEFNETEIAEVHIRRNEVEVAKHHASNIQAAKRWAERNYLKGKK